LSPCQWGGERGCWNLLSITSLLFCMHQRWRVYWYGIVILLKINKVPYDSSQSRGMIKPQVRWNFWSLFQNLFSSAIRASHRWLMSGETQKKKVGLNLVASQVLIDKESILLRSGENNNNYVLIMRRDTCGWSNSCLYIIQAPILHLTVPLT
jgi:hypothetical protein